MHMNPVAARRTQPGAPVVHGVHALLWLLDSMATRHPDLPPIGNLRVRFEKFIYLDEIVHAVLLKHDGEGISADVLAGSVAALRLTAKFGDTAAEPPRAAGPALHPTEPIEVPFDVLEHQRGRVGLAAPVSELAEAFPALSRVWGGERVAALAGLSRLVGMVCPGMHSIFDGLQLEACAIPTGDEAIAFAVTLVDPRFRLVRMKVAGSGVAGTIDTFARLPPPRQGSMAELGALVDRAEFAGSTALVVGGSRGLGELTAKLIAAGGGRVIITYVTGSADAETVAGEIAAEGGTCSTMPYDTRLPAQPQVAALEDAPSHVYYMATPSISRRKSGLFVRERLLEFLDFYVAGFWNLCEVLRQRRSDLSVFYPSSVFVEARPDDMTEYAMAKQAGEMLCADMNRYLAPLRITVSRLPRVLTDQTATLLQRELPDARDVMLPIIRSVQGER